MAQSIVEHNQDTSLVVLNVGKPRRNTHKLTPKKRKEFLEQYAKTGNMSKSALHIGCDRQSIYELIRRDDKFKAAFQYVEDHITDTIEGISLQVALQPDARGFNDRKLQLTARRPEKYNPKQEVEINQQVTVTISTGEIRQVLGHFSPGRELEAKYTVIEEDKAD